ncbi:MAG: flagellin [Acetobacteraceae bacterium]|nr:flagellin [Acetobacteraceae bacterium]
MSLSINTNVTAMAAIRSLSMIANETTRTQARVESGLRINKANDDPAVFTIAQNMRADLNGMAAVRDSLAFGKATLSVARDAATKISDELGKLKQTITQGQQQGLDSTQINAQITNALSNMDAYAKSATFNGVNLLVNGVSGVAGVTTSNLGIVRDIQGAITSLTGTNSTTAGVGSLNLNGLTVAQSAFEMTFGSALAVSDADTVTITAGSRTVVFEFNEDADAVASTASATQDVYNVQFTATDSTLARLGAMVTRMQQAGFNAAFTNDGRIIVSGGSMTALAASNTDMTATQIGGATGAIALVEAAIDTMGARLATLGATLRQVEGLQDFTKQLNDSVKEGLGSLVDADLAEESARLTSLQTKQQLAVQSLSIANQAPQSLLGLFR